jgi:hypothetical protein
MGGDFVCFVLLIKPDWSLELILNSTACHFRYVYTNNIVLPEHDNTSSAYIHSTYGNTPAAKPTTARRVAALLPCLIAPFVACALGVLDEASDGEEPEAVVSEAAGVP